jgi:ADP-heptose:LPS heptosyltransferase
VTRLAKRRGVVTQASRLFILKPDNLGDVVLFSGALRHLRARFPDARITLCVKRYVGNLVEHCPYVDEVVYWEDLHARWPAWVHRVRGMARIETAIRRRRAGRRFAADVAILPVRAPAAEMHETLRWIPARERYGIAGCHSNQSPEVDRAAAPIYTTRVDCGADRNGEHEITVYRQLLAMLGVSVDLEQLHPEFWTTDADRAWAETNVVRDEGLPLIGIAPGVSAPQAKAYAPERYREVIAGLRGRRVAVVLFGGDPDRDVCESVSASLAGLPGIDRIQNLAGLTTVRQLVESIRLTDVVLGPDSAPMHVAVGLRRATVSIVGGGQFGRFHPWGDPSMNRVVNLPMSCYGCDWSCIFSTMRCVVDIPESSVSAALVEVLDGAEARVTRGMLAGGAS